MTRPSPRFRIRILANLLSVGLLAPGAPRAQAAISVGQVPSGPVHPGQKVYLSVCGLQGHHHRFQWLCLEPEPGLFREESAHSVRFIPPAVDSPRTFRFLVRDAGSSGQFLDFAVEVTPWPSMELRASSVDLVSGETCTLLTTAPARNGNLRFRADLRPEDPGESPSSLRTADACISQPAHGPVTFTAPQVSRPMRCRVTALSWSALPAHVDLRILPMGADPGPAAASAGAAPSIQKTPSVSLFAGSPRERSLPEDPTRPPFTNPRALACLQDPVADFPGGWVMGNAQGVWSVTGDGKEPILLPSLGRDVTAMATGPAGAAHPVPLVVAHRSRWNLPNVPMPAVGAEQGFLTILEPDGRTRLLAGSEVTLPPGRDRRDGAAPRATFGLITGLAVDEEGRVYVAEGRESIRVVDPDGKVRTLVGSRHPSRTRVLAYDPARHVLYAGTTFGVFEVTRDGLVHQRWASFHRNHRADVRAMALHGDKVFLSLAHEAALHVFDLTAGLLSPLVPFTPPGKPLREGPLQHFAPGRTPKSCGAMPRISCLTSSPTGLCLAGLPEGLAQVDTDALFAPPGPQPRGPHAPDTTQDNPGGS